MGTDYIYTTQKEDNISNNIEKVNIINDGGGEGGRGHPLKVNHRRDLIATPKPSLIVTTQPSPNPTLAQTFYQNLTQNLMAPGTCSGVVLIALLAV